MIKIPLARGGNCVEPNELTESTKILLLFKSVIKHKRPENR